MGPAPRAVGRAVAGDTFSPGPDPTQHLDEEHSVAAGWMDQRAFCWFKMEDASAHVKVNGNGVRDRTWVKPRSLLERAKQPVSSL